MEICQTAIALDVGTDEANPLDDRAFLRHACEGWPWAIAELQKANAEMERLREFREAYKALGVAKGIAAIAAAVTRFDEARAALEEGEHD